ncbi:uncharacterized protein MELLADRAFT_68718 [Melampsora larici-populina 98AG31]|uniref:DUF1014-domain-containing protein n=1 Tax=Melampsora larici-populina (strain 98AG31 / pathotype 3-4-7) TaxID=747676 RepID=F4S7X9_MELLP|nr:uncharacterized protein MELLADRAFT_68718 [Melampsora larici-populina 98AG31]EGF99250.1 hypothetical protein MELLADRAFT_68718 [Melampsora larici-populina 98AG31]
MAKGGGKGASAKAAKSAHEAEVNTKKKEAAEAAEAEKWSDGAKGKAGKEEKAAKAAAAKAAKAERDRIAEEEAASIARSAPKPKAAPSKSSKPKATSPKSTASIPSEVPEYEARGIDNILALSEVVLERNDKASLGAKAAISVDAHPERRFKAAFEAYKETELPIARKEHPGLRLQQYHDLLYKQFQKHPDNPFNQTVVSYDATKEDKVAALKSKRKEVEEGFAKN